MSPKLMFYVSPIIINIILLMVKPVMCVGGWAGRSASPALSCCAVVETCPQETRMNYRMVTVSLLTF